MVCQDHMQFLLKSVHTSYLRRYYMIWVVNLYFSNWIASWSTMEHFVKLDNALDYVDKMYTPDLQTVSIVRRKKI